jgi:hypothetical protein
MRGSFGSGGPGVLKEIMVQILDHQAMEFLRSAIEAQVLMGIGWNSESNASAHALQWIGFSVSTALPTSRL